MKYRQATVLGVTLSHLGKSPSAETPCSPKPLWWAKPAVYRARVCILLCTPQFAGYPTNPRVPHHPSVFLRATAERLALRPVSPLIRDLPLVVIAPCAGHLPRFSTHLPRLPGCERWGEPPAYTSPRHPDRPPHTKKSFPTMKFRRSFRILNWPESFE